MLCPILHMNSIIYVFPVKDEIYSMVLLIFVSEKIVITGTKVCEHNCHHSPLVLMLKIDITLTNKELKVVEIIVMSGLEEFSWENTNSNKSKRVYLPTVKTSS